MAPHTRGLGISSSKGISSCQTVCACKWKGGKQTVECIKQHLMTVPDNIDANTQVLDLSGNNLHSLPNNVFYDNGLVNLQKIFLRESSIGQIDDEAFKGLTNLVELDLSTNMLTSVPSTALFHITSLRELILHGNPLAKVVGNSFRAVHSLTKLDLSHCDLVSIAPESFKDLHILQSLKLNGNRLSELRPRTIETLSQLHGIEIHDNPWYCDCRLRAAKIWLTQNNIPYPVAPACTGGPQRLLNRSFSDLTIDDFACRPELMHGSRTVEATTGDNATILCRTSGVPSPKVSWYFNGKQLVNGTAFSTFQKVYVMEDGEFEKRSRLIVTNVQESDSVDFFCTSENRAGSTETNFTLHVSMRQAGMAALANGEIMGLTAILSVVILSILLLIVFMLVRLRRIPFSESKTPGHLEVITTTVSPQSNGKAGGTISAGQHQQQQQHPTSAMDSLSDRSDRKIAGEMKLTNPLQKPPRLTDISYSTSHYDGNGSIISSTGPLFASPTASAGNNPDLINDTKRLGSDELVTLCASSDTIVSKQQLPTDHQRPGSGEYSRAGSDSLYPSGIWTEQQQQMAAGKMQQNNLANAAQQMYLRRATSTTLSGYGTGGYGEKTPAVANDGASMLQQQQQHGLQQPEQLSLDDETAAVEFMSRTFPRTVLAGAASNRINAAAATVTTSSSGTAVLTTTASGYPADYGLPVVCGAEHLKTREMLPPNGMPSNAKTLRVWQRGGVPVLPPVTALKRALTSSRNSPDEGYQEGCGTDV